MVFFRKVERRTDNICVFAAGSEVADIRYIEHARKIGELIAENGFGLVFGGVGGGLMYEVSTAAKKKGAKITGVVPRAVADPYFSQTNVRPLVALNDSLIGTSSLEDRKYTMLRMSDAVIALAGGLGTFDEIATTLEVSRGQKRKGAASRLVILNTLGFYDGTQQQFTRMYDERLVKAKPEDIAYFATTPEDAVAHIIHSLGGSPASNETQQR